MGCTGYPVLRNCQLCWCPRTYLQGRWNVTLEQIIEAAYHCAWSMDEIHSAVREEGLDEVSDETIHNLLGKYQDSIK